MNPYPIDLANNSMLGSNLSGIASESSNTLDSSVSLINSSRGSSKSTSVDIDGSTFVRKPSKIGSPNNTYDVVNQFPSVAIRTRFNSNFLEDATIYIYSNNTRIKSVLGFSTPLSLGWFFSVIGTEYCHTYFWIFKDLAWMQGLRKFSMFFGLLALLWSISIFYHGVRTGNFHELWNFIALFLWLFANFW